MMKLGFGKNQSIQMGDGHADFCASPQMFHDPSLYRPMQVEAIPVPGEPHRNDKGLVPLCKPHMAKDCRIDNWIDFRPVIAGTLGVPLQDTGPEA